MAWVHSTFHGQEALRVGVNRTHWGPIFNSAFFDRNKREGEEGIPRYMSTKTILVYHMEKPKNVKYGCFRVLLDMWVGWIAAAMRLEESYGQKLLICKTVGPFLITGKVCLPQTGYSECEHRRGTV